MLRKFKMQSYREHFTKSLLIAFSLVAPAIAVPSAFSHHPEPLNHLLTVHLEATSLHALFHLSKDPCKCYRYLSC